MLLQSSDAWPRGLNSTYYRLPALAAGALNAVLSDGVLISINSAEDCVRGFQHSFRVNTN